MEQPLCAICRRPVEEWDGGGGYGHNPDPVGGTSVLYAIKSVLDTDQAHLVSDLVTTALDERACNWCNQTVVIPVRLRMAGFPVGEPAV